MSLPRLDRIDRYGHCCVCCRNLITQRVVDGKVIEMFTPEHGHTDFLLDNGSIMKVCMCSICKNTYDLKDPEIHKEIMAAVMKGWELETDVMVADKNLPEWTEQSQKVYLDRMGKLNIDCHSDSLSEIAVQDRAKELTKIMSEDIEAKVE